MNERINGLWDKAVTLVEQEPDGDWSLDTIKDKFAELIVKECYQVCKENLVNDAEARAFGLTYNNAVGDCAIQIKQHFGVEL